MSSLAVFDKLVADIKQHVEPCMAIVITDDETQKAAYEAAKTIKLYDKMIEERRVELTKPLLDQKKKIDEYAKKISSPLGAAEAHIKGQLRAWEIQLEKKRQEEMKKAEEERQRQIAEAQAKLKAEQEQAEMAAMFMDEPEAKEVQAMAQVQAERVVEEIQQNHVATVTSIANNKVKGVSRPWVFDIEDESKIPREYLSIDPKKIREAIKAGVREIPGTKIYQDVAVSIR